MSAGVLTGFLRAVAGLAGRATDGIIGKFVGEVIKGTVVGGVVLRAASGGVDQALGFLLDQAPNLETLALVLGPDAQWVNLLANALMAIRQRSPRYLPR